MEGAEGSRFTRFGCFPLRKRTGHGEKRSPGQGAESDRARPRRPPVGLARALAMGASSALLRKVKGLYSSPAAIPE